MSLFDDYLGIRPIFPDKLIRLRVETALVTPAYLRLAGYSDLVREQIEAVCATTVGNWGISASNLRELCFPVPPLDEQRHIVAKAQQLMALCDRLETRLIAMDDQRTRLLNALLVEAFGEPLDAKAA